MIEDDLKYADEEIARLRALVDGAEFGGQYNLGRCPWCGAQAERDNETHRDDCPAFTPEGEVR